MKGTLACRMLLGALVVAVTVVAAVTSMGAGPASAASRAGTAVSSHVVIVGLSGLRWSDISASATPALWTVARTGSPGSLVDYAVLPRTCPADAWLTLNAGDRAQVPHTSKGPCPALPGVTARSGRAGIPGPARIAAMPSLVSYNRGLRYSPRWGLLASAAGNGHCATAVGPGAALALAGPAGHVGSYLPAVSGVSRGVLARCPLTVVDLGSLPGAPGGSRAAAVRHADTELAAITAGLPAGTTLVVTAPGSTVTPPHLQAVMISGPAYRSGLLRAPSTRQPGMVVLTDLTPTVLDWRGQPRPAGSPGSQTTRAGRGALLPSVRGLAGQDTTYQVWTSTHTIFFWTYALVDLAVFAGMGLLFWGAQPERRRRRSALWRVAGAVTGAVPAGSFLANLVPWWLMSHPAIWQYGLTLARGEHLQPPGTPGHRPGGPNPAETVLVRGQGAAPRLFCRTAARDDPGHDVAGLRARLVRRRLGHHRAGHRPATCPAARVRPAGRSSADRWRGGRPWAGRSPYRPPPAGSARRHDQAHRRRKNGCSISYHGSLPGRSCAGCGGPGSSAPSIFRTPAGPSWRRITCRSWIRSSCR